MITLDDVIKETAEKTGMDKETVREICKHVFFETERIMKDEDDTRDIMFNKLFKFKLKRRYKENKSQKYSSK